MKKIFSISVLVAILLAVSVVGQAQTETAESANANIIIAQGATGKISLQTQLSSKISEVGDEVIGVVYEPIRSADGRIAIPRGTEFIGRVAQVQADKRPKK
jgi:type IV secretory pathway VirB10-like protein